VGARPWRTFVALLRSELDTLPLLSLFIIILPTDAGTVWGPMAGGERESKLNPKRGIMGIEVLQ
jgi:hypothetical protein